jgi:2-(1,2-epoxy-1,2-dihydrophenyl)acetyl-CoA isomerase
MHPEIAITRADGVATVQIRRPPHNYFDPPLVVALVSTLLDLSALASVRCLLICSEGRSFCAGADFSRPRKEDNGTPPKDTGEERSWRPGHIYEEAARLFDVEVPMVAAVQGGAIGGGLGLALACDFRVATPRSRFVANFTRLGIHHGFGLSVTLPRVVGSQPTLRMLLAGRETGGEEALSIGLVDELVPEQELMAAANRLAQDVARLAPLAVRSIKRTLRGDLKQSVLSAIDREINEQSWLFRTADHREGVAALAEKRAPRFEGR